MKEIVLEQAYIINANKYVSKSNKEYFKADINDSDLGILSLFVPLELYPKLKVGERFDIVLKIDKDRFYSPVVKLSDVR